MRKKTAKRRPARRESRSRWPSGRDKRILSVTGHLGELRRRLIISLIAVAVGTVVCLAGQKRVLDFLRQPVERAVAMASAPSGFMKLVEERTGGEEASARTERLRTFAGELRTISPTEVILVVLKLALLCGLILALPVVLYQLWWFVAPGLADRERRYVLPALYVGTLLFAGGVWFAWSFAGGALRMLVLLTERLGAEVGWTLRNYFGFITVFLVLFGAIFELPLVMVILTRIGIVDPRVLASKRKYAILVIVIAAAILTPPDPFTQAMMALPLYLLFELGILVSKIFVRRRLAG